MRRREMGGQVDVHPETVNFVSWLQVLLVLRLKTYTAPTHHTGYVSRQTPSRGTRRPFSGGLPSLFLSTVAVLAPTTATLPSPLMPTLYPNWSDEACGRYGASHEHISMATTMLSRRAYSGRISLPPGGGGGGALSLQILLLIPSLDGDAPHLTQTAWLPGSR